SGASRTCCVRVCDNIGDSNLASMCDSRSQEVHMQAVRFSCAAVALSAVGVVACASSGRPEARMAANTASLPGKPACFFIASVRGGAGASWTVLDNSTLIMKVPAVQAGTPYLIKLMYPVFDLPLHINLGFQDVDHTGQICNDSRDNLVVPHYHAP